ncbi:FAD-binding oxidoreductase [Pseudomonas cremoricolorata]|uniref:FAD-binding oxidoreductase n=1 Tax=Pseudomonas cremoricolorata TaxID=157783 RepID=UPI000411E37E|nr:FAD-binding oxidoreductase [Pseudomonas cremoricolorata]
MNLCERIKAIVGANGWIDAAELRQRPVDFWNATPTLALGLARPASTEALSALLALCNEARQPLIIEGGRTNLVSATLGDAQTLLVSLERLNAIGRPDAGAMTLEVGAGAVLEHVQQVCAAADLRLGLDFGARGSASIGGALSTNAGGFQALRYGVARDQVLGLECVLADGTVLSHLSSYAKDNTGYDLKHLFIGSEGTLGVITKAVLKLQPKPTSCNTALLAFASFEQVIATLTALRRSLNGTLSAFELMWQEFFQFNVDALLQGRAPLDASYPYYALCEVEGFTGEHDGEHFQTLISDLFDSGSVVDAVIANSERQRAELWRIREEFEDEIQLFSTLIDFDVSLPLPRIEHFADQVREALALQFPENLGLHVLAHLGDGNVHVTTGLPSAARKDDLKRCVYRIIAELGGSISAEHGIGLAKKAYLHYSRSPGELALMRTLKGALDPHNILNPGKVIESR